MSSAKKVRVRFAPSPTGGLHLGGVRTVLFNYLFARQHQGDFVLRIEDTDQTRFVAGAEDYILNCLQWCGMEPDESPVKPGAYAPYRQSERKPIYRAFAEQLFNGGQAYYAFDTPVELEYMRTHFKTEENPSPQYDHKLRMQMRNSLTLPKEEVESLLQKGVPYVIRIKMPEDETIGFTDMIRGEVNFNTNQVDDKVLLKADGMPTYHLAVVVDDYMMKITHAFRGEEWLPSAPVHLLLWKYLGLESDMPQWAHLPLILGPDGSKLSKRHGNKYGFPIFAMNWTDLRTNDFTEGFRERGFLPEAFVNLLAMLGWNDGSGQEVFSLAELVEKFDIKRVGHSGAIFDFEKAKWYNHEWIKRLDNTALLPYVKQVFDNKEVATEDGYLLKVIGLVKDRCSLLPDFWEQGFFFFDHPKAYDLVAALPKWNEKNKAFFESLQHQLASLVDYDAAMVETNFKALATEHGIKVGELQMLFRIMLVGGKFGPAVFDIAAAIGQATTVERIGLGIAAFSA